MSDFSVTAKVTVTPPARAADIRERILAAARARLEEEARARSPLPPATDDATR